MITEKEKAAAIAQIKMGLDEEEIADTLCIPLYLIKEWKKSIGYNEMVKIEAIAVAANHIMSGELVPEMEDKLMNALEQAALDIANCAANPAKYGDVIQAKAVQLCANAVTQLYQTLILKNNPASAAQNNKSNSLQTLIAFQDQLKD